MSIVYYFRKCACVGEREREKESMHVLALIAVGIIAFYLFFPSTVKTSLNVKQMLWTSFTKCWQWCLSIATMIVKNVK